ncbi:MULTISPECIES: fibronectin type III domain-containing protein [unclassified Paenibacillus]|uniref:fibronectin type III domain-containing protein n=1 Tax=unclassified Paenibacillus TaxID=185978 RepID=UPI003630DAED
MNTKPWGIKDQNELFTTALGVHEPGRELHITRLAPGDGCVQIDWLYAGDVAASSLEYRVEYNERNSSEKSVLVVEGPKGSFALTSLENGCDYEIRLTAVERGTERIAADSPIRLTRPGIVPGSVINYIHPDDYTYNFSGRSPASPSIVRLPDGRLLASHDVFWGLGGQNLSVIFRSEDEGNTWRFVTYLYPCFWGKLFVHRGRLFMIATSTEYGELMIGGSDDGGETWSSPRTILPGGSRENGGPHKAPMPVIVHNGRIWTAVEHGSWTLRGHKAGVVSAPEDADLLDPASWTASPFIPYDSSWPGTVQGGDAPGVLEGNVVITPEGGLVNVLRYNTKGGTPDYGRAIMLNVDKENPGASLSFRQVIRFEGNMSKFTIQFDPESKRYWSLVNRVTSSNIHQRNILTLVASDNLEEWTTIRDILDYEHNEWTEDNTKVGFQYVDWFFDGDVILVASRTAINGAYNYHNANYMTFHRIEAFRKSC